MTEPDLEHLIKVWYQRDMQESAEYPISPSPECPPLTRLWQNPPEGVPLGEYEDHVEQCDRCRRISDIILRERFRAGEPSITKTGEAFRPLKTRPLVALAGFLAAAACIAILVVSWPQPNLEIQVAAFAEHAYLPFADSAMRGAGGEKTDGDQKPDWISRTLADPTVQEAIEVQQRLAGQILFEINEGRLHIDLDGRLRLADASEGTAHHRPVDQQRLQNLIQRDRDATERIVHALVQAIPDASEQDRSALQRALDRWRAEEVFGIPEKEERK